MNRIENRTKTCELNKFWCTIHSIHSHIAQPLLLAIEIIRQQHVSIYGEKSLIYVFARDLLYQHVLQQERCVLFHGPDYLNGFCLVVTFLIRGFLLINL